MRRLHVWATDIHLVRDSVALDEIIGSRYNFRIYRDPDKDPRTYIQLLNSDKPTFHGDLKEEVADKAGLEPYTICTSPPSDYKSTRHFESQRSLTDEETKELADLGIISPEKKIPSKRMKIS